MQRERVEVVQRVSLKQRKRRESAERARQGCAESLSKLLPLESLRLAESRVFCSVCDDGLFGTKQGLESCDSQLGEQLVFCFVKDVESIMQFGFSLVPLLCQRLDSEIFVLQLLKHCLSLYFVGVGNVIVEHWLRVSGCDRHVIHNVSTEPGWPRWNQRFEFFREFTFSFFLVVIVVTPITVGVEEFTDGARRPHSMLSDAVFDELCGGVYLADVGFELCADEV